jgi:putative transposase
MKLIRSGHCVHQLGVHVVFCPKYRHIVLSGAIEVELKRVIGETCRHYRWLIESLEIQPDHVHLFVQIDPFTTPAEIAKTIKSITAIQIFTIFPRLKGKKFWGSGLWSAGTYYGAVGQVNEETIRKYIEGQKSP